MSDKLYEEIRHVFYHNKSLDTDSLAMILLNLLERIQKLEGEQHGNP